MQETKVPAFQPDASVDRDFHQTASIERYSKEYNFIYDTGIDAVLFDSTLKVYRQIRRLVWRSTKSMGVDSWNVLRKKGSMISIASNAALIARTGLSERAVSYALSDLRELGWVIRKGSNVDYALVVGEFASPLDSQGTLFADRWFLHLHEKLCGHAASQGLQPAGQDYLRTEVGGGLTWEARVEFCREHIRILCPKARIQG